MITRRGLMAGAALGMAAWPVRGSALRPLRVAATNQRVPIGFVPLEPGLLGFKFRTLHLVSAPVSRLVFGFCGWAVPSNLEVDGGAGHRYDKVALECRGRSVPITFGGRRSVTIVGGMPYVLSDPVIASSLGLSVFSRNLPLYVRAAGTALTEQACLPWGTPAEGFGMTMSSFAIAGRIDDVDATGDMVLPPGANRHALAPGPSLILGRIPARALAVVCAGDSIADGIGDIAQLMAGPGFFSRAALNAQGLGAIGSLNITKSGSTAGTVRTGFGVAGAPGFRYRQALLPFGNVLVEEYGTNTLGSTSVNQAQAVLANSRPLWTLARAAGIERIVRTTLLCVTDSTDRFTTLTGQTPRINWCTGQARDAVNAAFAQARDSGEIDAVVDCLSAVSDPLDRARWAVDGNINYATRDGIHPSSVGARAMASVLRATYARLSVS